MSHSRGPNGGTLFSQDNFSAELVAPESQDGSAPMSLYLAQGGQQIVPGENTRVSMEVRRPSGEVNTLRFEPKGDAFVSAMGVAEPHYFEARILIEREGRAYRFSYAKEEGLIELSNEQIDAAGIQLVKATAGAMSTTISLPGEIRFDEDHTAHVVPRTAGVVESVQVNLGESVKKGQLLAVIASQQISDQRSEFPLSISAGVGFIALSGVAVLNGLAYRSEGRRIRRCPARPAHKDTAMLRAKPRLALSQTGTPIPSPLKGSTNLLECCLSVNLRAGRAKAP